MKSNAPYGAFLEFRATPDGETSLNDLAGLRHVGQVHLHNLLQLVQACLDVLLFFLRADSATTTALLGVFFPKTLRKNMGSSLGMMKFLYGKTKLMFQTTRATKWGPDS